MKGMKDKFSNSLGKELNWQLVLKSSLQPGCKVNTVTPHSQVVRKKKGEKRERERVESKGEERRGKIKNIMGKIGELLQGEILSDVIIITEKYDQI